MSMRFLFNIRPLFHLSLLLSVRLLSHLSSLKSISFQVFLSLSWPIYNNKLRNWLRLIHSFSQPRKSVHFYPSITQQFSCEHLIHSLLTFPFLGIDKNKLFSFFFKGLKEHQSLLLIPLVKCITDISQKKSFKLKWLNRPVQDLVLFWLSTLQCFSAAIEQRPNHIQMN